MKETDNGISSDDVLIGTNWPNEIKSDANTYVTNVSSGTTIDDVVIKELGNEVVEQKHRIDKLEKTIKLLTDYIIQSHKQKQDEKDPFNDVPPDYDLPF